MSGDLPNVVLSIRQPWVWLILAGVKPVENRVWATKFRGPILLHAAKGMTRAEYDEAQEMAWGIQGDLTFPWPDELPRGGIVGMATIVDCVPEHRSPWFGGPYGFVLEDVQALPFVPTRGRLGLFRLNDAEMAAVRAVCGKEVA